MRELRSVAHDLERPQAMLSDPATATGWVGSWYGNPAFWPANEYAYDAEAPQSAAQLPGSVFTTKLVNSIETGEADSNRDGYVSADEAFHFAADLSRGLASCRIHN